MYVINDIVYAGEPVESMTIIEVKVIDNLCLIITFSTNEQRIFDCSELLNYPIYQDLLDDTVFHQVSISNGILTWKNGDIDISTERVYRMSYPYNTLKVI